MARIVQIRLPYGDRECGERVVKLLPGHGLGASPVAQLIRRFAREVECVGDSTEALREAWRPDGPFPAGVSERDEVACQVSAVYRGDVGRIKRTQIACVVPVVEMPTKACETAHG